MSSSSEIKQRILCLHGYRQSMDTFKQKLGSFRKPLKAHAEFIFANAPHKAYSDTPEPHDERSWWYTSPDKTYVSKTPSDCDEGFKESVEYLQEFVKEEGPFDGILGFSQGATFAAIICSLIQSGKFQADFKYAILVAGFLSRCSPHSIFYQSPINISSLHVIGETDGVISKERSEELLALFPNSKLLSHPGGHYVPASKEYKDIYINFIKS